MTKKTQLWLGILVGGGVAYYLYSRYKKTGKWFSSDGNNLETTKLPAKALYDYGWSVQTLLDNGYTNDELIQAGIIDKFGNVLYVPVAPTIKPTRDGKTPDSQPAPLTPEEVVLEEVEAEEPKRRVVKRIPKIKTLPSLLPDKGGKKVKMKKCNPLYDKNCK